MYVPSQTAGVAQLEGASIVIDLVPSTLCSGAGIKAAGDSAFKVRDVEGATRHYTAALKVDPLFVS